MTIDSLPDECLFEILRRVDGARGMSLSACVSKRWLHLLSSSLIPSTRTHEEVGEDALLLRSRCLEGKEATDNRLIAAAMGSSLRVGGFTELLIRGCSNSSRPSVTDAGLAAVARASPFLKVLSLCNTPSVTDEGLARIADRCPLLEKLDLRACASVSDKGLTAIALKCSKLSSLAVESCPGVGNDGLQAVGRLCPLLTSVSIADLDRVADQGVASLVSSAAASLERLSLRRVNVTDASLAVIGHYGEEISDLSFDRLPLIGERGFWVMGSGRGLRKLRSFSATACAVTDVGLRAVAQGCPALKKLHVQRCIHLSDVGLNALASAAVSLETLQLEECHRISLAGILGLLEHSAKLESLDLVGCMGVKDSPLPLAACRSPLRSLRISRCPGFGDSTLVLVGKLCPRLLLVHLSGLAGVTDAGLMPLFENCKAGLDEVVLRGCAGVTDAAVSALARQHGGTLQTLSLEGCGKVSDESLVAVADNCIQLENLDVSKSSVGDEGVAALASAVGAELLQVLSLSGCSMISPRSLHRLSKLDHTLQGLNLQMCNAISRHAVSSFQRKMPLCDILS